MRQTYGLYGTVVILRILGTRLEQHSSHNFGWLRAFVGSLSGGISGPSRFLPCLCGTEYNTNRRCYYMVVLLFRRAIRGAGRRGKRAPQSVPALNRDRPLIGTSPSYSSIPPKSVEVVPFKKDQHRSHVFPHLRVSNTIILRSNQVFHQHMSLFIQLI